MTGQPGRRAGDLVQVLSRAERLMDRHLATILLAQGHSPASWRVLTLLAVEGGRPMSELAEQAGLPPATLTKLVDGLCETNLVYRRVDDADRRRIRAYLTPRGRALHTRIQREIGSSLADLALGDSEQELLTGLLTHLIGVLDGATARTGRGNPAG